MSELTLSKDEHVEFIIKNFNFKKVKKVMDFLKWEWTSVGVPSIPQLKKEATNLLYLVCDLDGEGYYVSCGGFKATRYSDSIELSFNVDDYDSEVLNHGAFYEKAKKQKDRKNKISKIEQNEYIK